MAANTKDSISKVKRTVKVNIFGKMAATMWERGETTKLTEMVPMCGQTAESIRANG